MRNAFLIGLSVFVLSFLMTNCKPRKDVNSSAAQSRSSSADSNDEDQLLLHSLTFMGKIAPEVKIHVETVFSASVDKFSCKKLSTGSLPIPVPHMIPKSFGEKTAPVINANGQYTLKIKLDSMSDDDCQYRLFNIIIGFYKKSDDIITSWEIRPGASDYDITNIGDILCSEKYTDKQSSNDISSTCYPTNPPQSDPYSANGKTFFTLAKDAQKINTDIIWQGIDN